MDPTTPELIVDWTVTDEEIKIKYKVRNTGDVSVYLVNVMTTYEKDRGRVPNPAEAYAFFFPDKKQIEFCKRVPPLPESEPLVHPYTWFVTELAAGQEFEEELAFSLPLKEHRPYLSFVGKPAPEARKLCVEACFVLGYFPADARFQPEEIVENGVQVLRILAPDEMPPPEPGTALPVEHLLRSRPKVIELQVTPLPDLVH